MTKIAVRRIFISPDAKIGKALRAVTLVVSEAWAPVDSQNSIQLPTNGTFVLSLMPLQAGGVVVHPAVQLVVVPVVVVGEFVEELFLTVLLISSVFPGSVQSNDGHCAKIGHWRDEKTMIIAREKIFFMRRVFFDLKYRILPTLL